MTYDMRDFLISCADRYCELAKVSRQSLATVPTPFTENRVVKPLEENEPAGHLQPIASKVLMKVLLAARMARRDLLRATQSLASRATKWGRDCDAALHRLVCYINSSLDVRMQGFIGDRISECKLWLFCDADWSEEHDPNRPLVARCILWARTLIIRSMPFRRNRQASRCLALRVRLSAPTMVFERRVFPA